MADENPLASLSESFKNIALPNLSAPAFNIRDYAIPDIHSYTPKSGWHQLIIVGNGFDKACTLKSGYGDFFKTRRNRLYPDNNVIQDSEFSTWGEYIASQGITVWDLILQEFPDVVLWNDIEKAIEEWLVKKSETVPRSDSFARTMSLLNLDFLSDIQNRDRQKANWPSYENRAKRKYREITIAQYILDNTGGKQSKWTEAKLSDFLLAELHRFENEFSSYLMRELENNAEYEKKSIILMIDLIAEQLPRPDDKDVLVSILNFNYTTPKLPKFNGVEIEMTNIHGQLGSEVVFGIDGKECMDEGLAVRFTKTYRLLGLHTTEGNRLFDSVGSFSSGAPLDVIKIFGHSLASPDYSYFQALFDSVNLYGSDVKLIFYYRNHREDGKTEATAFNNVTRLLNAYGLTMDNQNHGKNLMHKLLLEGRLSVKELPHVPTRYDNE